MWRQVIAQAAWRIALDPGYQVAQADELLGERFKLLLLPEDRLAQQIKGIVGKSRLDLKLGQSSFKHPAIQIAGFWHDAHTGAALRLSLVRFRVLRFSHMRTPANVAHPSNPMVTITLP